ncbi:MAG: hypothetical protein IJD82_05190 [Clostridia bacterium]|nr:hypothetical protein [Clostridia bacterium]
MKRALYLLLALACLFTALCGCKKDEPSLPTGADPIESYDEEHKITPEKPKQDIGAEISDVSNGTQDEDTSETPTYSSPEITEIVGEFTVKHKKYLYEGNNLVLLYFENGTNAHYTVTIEGIYKDANGNVLHTETQTYNDIASGTNAYFLFKPDMIFESFEYKIASEQYTGILYRSNLVPVDYSSELDIKLQYWYGHFKPPKDDAEDEVYLMHQLTTSMQYIHYNDVNTYSDYFVIVFDSNDQIIVLMEKKYRFSMNKNNDPDQYWSQDFHLFYSHEMEFSLDRETWPENLKGGFYGVMVVQAVRTKEETPEQYWAPEDRNPEQ